MDRVHNFRSSNDLRDPTSRSKRHKPRWANCNRPRAADAVVADAVAQVPVPLRSKARLSSKTRNAASIALRTLRILKVRAPKDHARKVHLAPTVRPAAIAARARTVPAARAVRALIDRRVLTVPKAVPIVRPLPSVPCPPTVPRLLTVPRQPKVQALPPMPRRASAAASVAVVAVVVVVARARAEARRKASRLLVK